MSVHGFKVIGEMSKEELIAELMEVQHTNMLKLDEDKLKRHVIHARMVAVQDRLMAEANLDPEFNLFGGIFGQSNE